ncbi:MAG: DUF5104 domain-containing protein [Clostridia bacterium]|nr:DUF5104 domain-containing protein [Clostridia bacterium]
MKHTKTIAGVVLAAVLAASFTGCGRLITDVSSILEETYEISYAGERSQMERSEDMMDDIISCINNNDKKGLKSLFSEVAIDRADTLDDDLDYLLENYDDIKAEGEISCSAYGQGGDQGWFYLSCYCDVETSQGTMRLSWEDCPRKVDERSCEGLYSLAVMDITEIFYKTAGVYKPELKNYMIKGRAFVDADGVRFHEEIEYVRDCLSDECFEDHDEEELLALEWFLASNPVANYLKWAKESEDTVYVFIEMYLNHHSVVLCAGYDKENPDKITHISLVDCDKDSTPPADTPSSDKIIKAGLGDVLDIYTELYD